MLKGRPASKATCISLLYSMKNRAVKMSRMSSPKKNPVPTRCGFFRQKVHMTTKKQAYAKASYSCPGCLGSMSTLSKTKAQGRSVGLPIISEFIRLPRRMKHEVTGTAMEMLSSTVMTFIFILRQ